MYRADMSPRELASIAGWYDSCFACSMYRADMSGGELNSMEPRSTTRAILSQWHVVTLRDPLLSDTM
jgi:hypothetical protein